MSWELMHRKRYSCPCKKGEYEVTTYSDDWFRTEEHYIMLCSECAVLYVYDPTVIHGHPGDEVSRGWVLKSILKEEQKRKEEEEKHRNDIVDNAKNLYFRLWESKFKNLKTKKDFWNVLTIGGKYRRLSR